MKIQFLLFPILLACQGCSQKAQSSYITIPVNKFEKMAAQQDNVIIDVRTPEEVAEGWIPRSLNIDFLGNSLLNEIEKLDKNEKHLLYCRSGTRSLQAATLMQQAGFKHVYTLEGGINAWQNANKPH